MSDLRDRIYGPEPLLQDAATAPVADTTLESLATEVQPKSVRADTIAEPVAVPADTEASIRAALEKVAEPVEAAAAEKPAVVAVDAGPPVEVPAAFEAAIPEMDVAVAAPPPDDTILSLDQVSIGPRKGRAELDRVSLALKRGETVVLFGEEGSGKEILVRAVTGTLERNETVSGVLRVGQEGMATRIAYLPGPFLNPLSPHATVASQLSRVIMRKLALPDGAAREELRQALARLDGAPPFERLLARPQDLAPEELCYSLLAAAMAQTPELLVVQNFIADLALMPAKRLIGALLAERERLGFALLYSARGAQVLNWIGGRVVMMRMGRIVEEGTAERLASGASHAYTRTLFRGLPRLATEASSRNGQRGEPMLQVRGLELERTEKSDRLLSREGLTFELRRGAAIAFVGEEGSGRRKLARTLIGLERPGAGRIVLEQVDIGILSEAMLHVMRRRIAFIVGSDDVLDARMTIRDTVAEPLRAHLNVSRDVLKAQVEGALKRVGLADPSRRVAALSRFDRRRLQVARAIVTQPHIAIIDEPLRGLDAFGQGIIRELLREFRRQEGAALIVITADFSVASAFAEEAIVFHNGRVVERGPLVQMLKSPKDVETRRLIDAVAAAALPLPDRSV